MGATDLGSWCDGWDEDELEEKLVWLVGAGKVLEGDFELSVGLFEDVLCAGFTSDQALLSSKDISAWLLNGVSVLLCCLDLWIQVSELIGGLGQACEYTLKASIRFGSVLLFLIYISCCMRFFNGPVFVNYLLYIARPRKMQHTVEDQLSWVDLDIVWARRDNVVDVNSVGGHICDYAEGRGLCLFS